MRLGILYEGSLDEAAFLLIRRILEGCVDETIEFKPYPADGPIESKIKPALKSFFGESDAVAAAIFLSDVDGNTDRPARIERSASAEIAANYAGVNVAFGFPSPHFEEWFVREENAVKKLYRLDPSAPLPFSEIRHSKMRLQEIHDTHAATNTSDIEMLTRAKSYQILAEQIDLRHLFHRNKEFEYFFKNLRGLFGCTAY